MPKAKNLLPLDELNLLDYDYCDKMLSQCNRKLLNIFWGAKARLLRLGAEEVLALSKEMYEDALDVYLEYLYMIADYYYKDRGGKGKVPRKWVKKRLQDYDPVCLYIFLSEWDRKCSRFAESVIASTNKGQAVDDGLKYLSRQVAQGMENITDQVALKAMKDNGVKQVVWITVIDERRCKRCKDMHGNIYDIDKVPPKPHPRCRCVLIPYRQ